MKIIRHTKTQEQTQSEGTKRTSELDPDVTQMLELLERGFKMTDEYNKALMEKVSNNQEEMSCIKQRDENLKTESKGNTRNQNSVI